LRIELGYDKRDFGLMLMLTIYFGCFVFSSLCISQDKVATIDEELAEVASRALERYCNSNERFHGRFDLNGNLKSSRINEPKFNRIIEFYDNEEVHRELELTKTQQKELIGPSEYGNRSFTN